MLDHFDQVKSLMDSCIHRDQLNWHIRDCNHDDQLNIRSYLKDEYKLLQIFSYPTTTLIEQIM